MSDFLWKLGMATAVLMLLFLTMGLTKRVETLEVRVLDQPRGNCVEVSDLYRNRRYPPAHGEHSYAKPVPICGKVKL